MRSAPRRPAERAARWQRATEWPLVAVAVLFFAAYAWEVLDTTLPHPLRLVLDGVVTVSWAVFALDYVVRLVLAPDRRAHVRTHVLDLLLVVLPVLRPLRMLRLVTLLAVLHRLTGANLRGRVASHIAGAAVLLITTAALAELDAERGAPGALITTFADALWWALTTVTTVGYGDLYPVTAVGRLIAAGLMLCGIALLGVVTATVAAWFLDRVRESEEHAQAATRHDVAELLEEVRRLRARLEDDQVS